MTVFSKYPLRPTIAFRHRRYFLIFRCRCFWSRLWGRNLEEKERNIDCYIINNEMFTCFWYRKVNISEKHELQKQGRTNGLC